MSRKRKDVKFLLQSGSRLEVKEMTPEASFVFDLFNASMVQNLDSEFERNISKVLLNLGQRSQNLLSLRYGFETGEPMSYEKLAVFLQFKSNSARNKVMAVIRRLEPFREILLKSAESPLQIPIGKDRMELVFVEDLQKFIRREKTVFLDLIFKRRDIKLEVKRVIRKKVLPELTEQFSLLRVRISELHLSAEAMHELKLCGILQVSELLLTNQLSEMLSEPIYRELMEKIKFFQEIRENQQPDYYTVTEVMLINSGNIQKSELTFDGDSISESLVLNKIYEMLCDRERNGLNLFDVEVPIRLKNLLLMKGYFYLTDIFKDAENLLTELIHYNMYDFLEEFQDFLQSGAVSVARINEQTESFLSFYNIDSLQKLTEIHPSDEEKLIREQLLNWCNANILCCSKGDYHGDMSAVLDSSGSEDEK